jgi:menaquinone-dependent protoporphyrinogen oxidase
VKPVLVLYATREGHTGRIGWHPSKVRAAAGALSYTKYNFLVRFVMKRIAKAQGASTDTSRDHELTDWEALDRIVDEVVPNPESR